MSLLAILPWGEFSLALSEVRVGFGGCGGYGGLGIINVAYLYELMVSTLHSQASAMDCDPVDYN